MAKLISADLTNNTLCILEYTTNNRKMLSFKEDKFDAKIVSHTYTDIGKIIFDRPVTNIGEKAFYRRFSLTSVTIPDSIKTIGSGAFSGCINLKEFKGKFAADGGRCLIMDNTIIAYVEASDTTYTIPDSVTTIGVMAFSDCLFLTSVTIPDSVTTIGVRAFNDCKNLTSVTIPDGVTTIGEFAFNHCCRLTSVTIPDGVTRIGDYVFNGCISLTNVTIPNSVISIGKWAFYGCNSLTNIIIPDSVTTIEDNAFYNCQSLQSIIISNSVILIGKGAFYGCKSLTSIIIPDSVTAIGDMVFGCCKSLTEFKGKFVSDDGRCLIVYGILNSFAPAELSEYNIPNSVTTIGDGAFCGCDNLTSVTISNRVTAIGVEAFYGCKSLSSVTIGKSVRVIFEEAFGGCNIDTIVCCPKMPPKIYGSLGKFNNLVVPTGCEEDYANSDWGQYLD